MRAEELPIEFVTVQDRLRRDVNEAQVVALMQSMAAIGLKTPIAVRPIPDEDGCIMEHILVAGRHRLEAARRLGWENILAFNIVDDVEARLWEIAENLHRAELSVQERAEHIAEWVRLTEEKNKGATCADIQRTRGQPKGGINAATRELGIDRTEAQRAVKIAAIAPEAKEAARDAGLHDNQSALLEIAKAKEPDAQVAKVAELKKRKSDRDIVRTAGDAIVKADGIEAAAQIILDFMHHEHVDDLLPHLDAGGVTKLAAAIRRARATHGQRTEADRPAFDNTKAGRAA